MLFRYTLSVLVGAFGALLLGRAEDGVAVTLSVTLKGKEEEGPKTLTLLKSQTARQAAALFLEANGVDEERGAGILVQLARTLQEQDALQRTAASGGSKLVLPVDIGERELFLEHTKGGDIDVEVRAFCESTGLEEEDLTACVGQLTGVLVQAIAANAQAEARAAALEAQDGDADGGTVAGGGGDTVKEAAGPAPLFTMPVAVPVDVMGADVTREQHLVYFADQTPAEAASVNCDRIMPEGSEPNAVAACIQWAGDLISAILREMSEMTLPAEVQQGASSQAPAGAKGEEGQVDDEAVAEDAIREEDVLYRVPVSVNDVETHLRIVQGRSPRAMAVACCAQPALAFMDVKARESCVVQLTELAAEVLKFIVQEEAKVRRQADSGGGGSGGAGEGNGADADEMLTELFSLPMKIGEKEVMLSMKVGESTSSCATRFCNEQKTSIYAAMVSRGLPAGPDLLAQCVRLVEDAAAQMLVALEADVAAAERMLAADAAVPEGKGEPILVIDINNAVQRASGDGGEDDAITMLKLKVFEGDTAQTASRRFVMQEGFPEDIVDQLAEAVAAKMVAASDAASA